jgi:5-bromo-4-chloroindolyl phosphate hydrolysis protein
MNTQTNNSRKSNAFKLSEQVKKILHEKGLSFLFTYQDYKYFKSQVSEAFNKAQEIANLFIQYHEPTKTDFSEYEF